MRGYVRMTPRPLIFALSSALFLVAACGGGDDDDGSVPGQLTDPDTVPTATPWPTQGGPETIILDPENIQPLPPSQPDGGADGGSPTPAAGEPGECGTVYVVAAGDTTFGIAEKCGVTVEAIEELNPDIDIRALTIGEEINLPPVTNETPD